MATTCDLNDTRSAKGSALGVAGSQAYSSKESSGNVTTSRAGNNHTDMQIAVGRDPPESVDKVATKVAKTVIPPEIIATSAMNVWLENDVPEDQGEEVLFPGGGRYQTVYSTAQCVDRSQVPTFSTIWRCLRYRARSL